MNEQLFNYELELEDGEPAFACLDCFRDPWLKEIARKLVRPRQCAFCGAETEFAQTPGKIAEVIRDPLMKHYKVDWGQYPGYEMSLAKIIGLGIGSVSTELCHSVADLLVKNDVGEEDFYFHGQDYCVNPSPFESKEDQRFWAESGWHAISTELIHGQRFFNNKAKNFFESLIFEAIWGAKEKLDAPQAVKEIPAGSPFYRARISKNNAELSEIMDDPGLNLGAPPRQKAANNRMSAAGVPLMYVSGDVNTCIAEVRPSIGDQVVVGKFTSTKVMRIFDFTVLENLEHESISIFHPLYDNRAERRQLVKVLHGLIARPVRSTDTDYVMTQALAECIRYSRHDFDGVAFRSVQRSGGGVNYVLFDKSSSDSMLSPTWVPEFNLEITVDSVLAHQVEGVEYRTQLMPTE
ncbi:RES family NAD+ phosphorylase [Pseudomonas qingdaonensis]|uniref:RES family NAD+ phosphorylase n=1 Tax=Pseudomonas qingdaonensis TaxID=2056231 RepID=UPI0028A8C0FB|nr:RES family NAD+ phosphorylase [Pseudomonas qingdaonensis]